VTLVTTHGEHDDPDGLREHLPDCEDIVSVPHDVPKQGTARFALGLARSWLSRDPIELWRWRVPAVQDAVAQLLHRQRFDLCVADFLLATANVPVDRSTPVVLFEHNVEYMIWQRLAKIAHNPVHKTLLEIEWRKLRRREAAACSRADLTIAVSEADRNRLCALAPGARIVAVPTGVDTGYFHPTPGHERPAHLVFTGSMDWHPNEDAIVYFADVILPLIRRAIADVSFTVVGRNPSERLKALARTTGIHLTGTVDDVRPYVDEAAVYVVPLRAGSGTRLKIFEALAMGKAVVSTTLGAEGLAVTDGRDILLADDPDAFARSVVMLLRDSHARPAFGKAGRDLVEAHYSWHQVAKQFEQCCYQVLERPLIAHEQLAS
jgi:glycosyltransferase involved in cell wall biosynthesis